MGGLRGDHRLRARTDLVHGLHCRKKEDRNRGCRSLLRVEKPTLPVQFHWNRGDRASDWLDHLAFGSDDDLRSVLPRGGRAGGKRSAGEVRCSLPALLREDAALASRTRSEIGKGGGRER